MPFDDWRNSSTIADLWLFKNSRCSTVSLSAGAMVKLSPVKEILNPALMIFEIKVSAH